MNFDIPLQLQPACMNLRHKMMYCDERQKTPGLIDATSETRVFFCIKTHDVLGPDNEAVHPTDCCTGRACFSDPMPVPRQSPSAPPPALS